MKLNQAMIKVLCELLPCLPDGVLMGINHCGGDSWTETVMCVTPDMVDGYLAALEAAGYKKHDESAIRENRFATHVNAEGFAVYSTYMPWNQTLCVAVDGPERYTALCDWQSEGDRTSRKKYDTALSQIGLCFNLAEGISPFDLEGRPGPDFTGGQFNILRLEDGSLIVIDGGHWRDDNGDLVYDMLRKHAPDPDNIVVAAWIFTHAHADHVLAFVNFSPRYSDKIKVERFIHNLIYAGDPNIYRTLDTIAQYYPDSQRIIGHAGQTYHIRNAELKIYCCYELVHPCDISWGNEASLVFSIEAAGKKIMFLADMGPKQNKSVRMMYTTEEFKSDFLQVAHHGWNGGHLKVNEMVAPDYVLFNGTTAPLDASWNTYFFEKYTYSSGVVEFRKRDHIKELYRAIEGVDYFVLREGEEPEAKVYPTHQKFLNADLA